MKHKIFFLLGSLLILLGGFGYGYTYMLDHRSADSLSAYCDIDFRADTDEHGKISTANLTLQDYRFAGDQLKPMILLVCDNDMYDIKASVRQTPPSYSVAFYNDKTTFITLYGLQGAHEEAERHNAAALAALDALGPKADFLRQMAAELLERKK